MTQRNDLISQYNVNIDALQQKTEEKAEYEQKQRELENRQVAHYDPDLPVITAYVVEAIYQSVRLRVTKLLDVLLRSRNVVVFVFGSDSDMVLLSLTSIVLTAARSDIQDLFSQEIEE